LALFMFELMVPLETTSPVAEKREVPVTHSCPFCHTAMQAGVIIDRISGSNTRPIWIPEPAVESWFGGLREPVGPEVLVSTERCPVCGYLASYGNPRLVDKADKPDR
jgi:hypothetical protein